MNEPQRPMRRLLRSFAKTQQREMVGLLERFVRCESPSHDKAAVDASSGGLSRANGDGAGAKVRVLRQTKRGNHMRAEIWLGDGTSSRANYDARATSTRFIRWARWRKMPFRVRGGRACGPGTFDMKAGLVLALAAVDALAGDRQRPRKRLVFFWNSDEEIGSDNFAARDRAGSAAKRCGARARTCSWPRRTAEDGAQRRGHGGDHRDAAGRRTRGSTPEQGVNAVHELALQIARLMKMNDPRRGITVQATVVAGGTASNVVPAHARAEVDIRYTRLADAAKLDREVAQFATDSERSANRGARRHQSSAARTHRRRAQTFRPRAIADAGNRR